MTRLRIRSIVWIAMLFCAALAAAPASAGCGCNKTPPPASYIRPAATYPGGIVTLIHPGLVAGQSYQVDFSSGVQAASASVTANAIARRDLADAVVKPQLAVPLPVLPLGPVAVRVRPAGSSTALMQLSDDQLTVTPAPIAIPQGATQVRFLAYSAAVSRDREVLISLDFTGLTQPRVFRARLQGLPLRFSEGNAVFYNVQGFLMQQLNGAMPGLFSITSSSSTDSDTLSYSRHEFNTYFLQHAENLPHAVDPTDGNWHLDGSRHIDHDHQILHIAGSLPSGYLAPGATPPATLVIDIGTLFQHGLLGASSVQVSNASTVDAYSPGGTAGFGGDVVSNGSVLVKGNGTLVDGDARGATVTVSSSGVVTGTVQQGAPPVSILGVQIPPNLPSMGDVKIAQSSQRIGRGSYRMSSLLVDNGATLYVDNADGPVTLYVEGTATIRNKSRVVVQDPDPEKFAIYVAGTGSVVIDNGGDYYGVVYAPSSKLQVTNHSYLRGSFVGSAVVVDNGAAVHYDRALRGQ
jgi:cytoskeletal protein CcmA (bactofilin family)